MRTISTFSVYMNLSHIANYIIKNDIMKINRYTHKNKRVLFLNQ